MMRRWVVTLGPRHIDTVFFDPDCDEEYVRRSLLDHDGYDPRIEVWTEED